MLGEYEVGAFPNELRGLSDILTAKPDVVDVCLTSEDGHHDILRRVDNTPMTREQMWRSHWTRDPEPELAGIVYIDEEPVEVTKEMWDALTAISIARKKKL